MKMPQDIGPFHIIGIGGIGMSAIAEILQAKGYAVQGSDQKESANVQRLRAKGVRVFVGHDAVNLVGARQVVISTAVKDSNPELAAARQKGLPIIRRAEMLAELMRMYRTISVTGTHGKTSTTSLVAHLFAEAKLDPTVITGGIINSWDSNARLGEGEWMIVEADESDGTFTHLPTEIGVVTNIDPEHLDFYKNVDNMHAAFEHFYRSIPFYGLTVTCIDHPVVREMVQKLNLRQDGRRLLTYGVAEDADLRLTALSQRGHVSVFDAALSERVPGGKRLLQGLEVPTPGQHNTLNALAALAIGAHAGISDDVMRSGLANFSGVKRRFQFTGEWNGIAFYDDYGHHPVEVDAVLRAARAGARGRVFAVVEPHRYSRVQALFQDFCNCFSAADAVVVAPLYSAGELPIDGIDQHSLARGIQATGHRAVTAISEPRELIDLVKTQAQPGDMVVCLGAGVSTEWANSLPEWLQTASLNVGSMQ